MDELSDPERYVASMATKDREYSAPDSMIISSMGWT
jgi:hypothetical protein